MIFITIIYILRLKKLFQVFRERERGKRGRGATALRRFPQYVASGVGERGEIINERDRG
jgi:hypothetical protein